MSAWSTLTSQWGSPLTLKSAYRDPVQNALANGARDSQHLHGNAFDVSTAGMSPEERASLIQAAQAAGFTGFGGYDNSLHFDVGPSRTWGSDYSGATTPDWLRSALGSAPVQVSTSGGPSMPMQEQPRGLFGFLGGEQTPDARTADQRKADLFNTLALGFNEMRLRPSQSLATGIQNRMASDRQLRTQQGRANRTVEWLKTQPNGSTAIQMIDAGADPAQAIQWLQQQNQAAASLARGEIKEVDGRLVRVMPDGTTQEVYNPYGNGTLSPDQLSVANTLRDDFRTDTAAFNDVKSAFTDLSAAYDQSASGMAGVSDYALVVGLAKVLDPTSVVRGEEAAAIQNTSGLAESVKAQLTQILSTGGGSLPQSVRDQIMQLASRRYNNVLGETQETIDQYIKRAEQANIPWEQIGFQQVLQPTQFTPAVPGSPYETPEQAVSDINSILNQ